MGERCHHAEHAAEAVEQRHRQAEPVGFSELLSFSDVVAVVENVVVAEHDPFRETGGPGGVLHVNDIMRIKG